MLFKKDTDLDRWMTSALRNLDANMRPVLNPLGTHKRQLNSHIFLIFSEAKNFISSDFIRRTGKTTSMCGDLVAGAATMGMNMMTGLTGLAWRRK